MFQAQPWDQREIYLMGGDPEAPRYPLGTYETQTVARTGKSSTLKILPKIGDCERSNVMLN